MKKLLLLLTFMVALMAPAYSQGATIAVKKPNEPITFSWNYVVADESGISGFKLKTASSLAGPFTDVTLAILPAARTASLPASFGSNKVAYFILVAFYTTADNRVIESDPSNSVEVDKKAANPTNLAVQ